RTSYSANSVSLIVYEDNQRPICRQQAKSPWQSPRIAGFKGSRNGAEGGAGESFAKYVACPQRNRTQVRVKPVAAALGVLTARLLPLWFRCTVPTLRGPFLDPSRTVCSRRTAAPRRRRCSS